MGLKWLILLICNTYAVTSYEFTFRSIYGNQNEGYVELRVNGTWGIMSAYYVRLDDTTAGILCRSFGFGLTGFSTSSMVDLELSHNALLWHNVIQCNGSESNATECVKGTWPNTGHWSSTLSRGWTRLHCFAYEITDMRLYGGLFPHVGRLEVKVGSRWGVVCLYPDPTRSSFRYDDLMCSLLGYAGESSRMNTSPLEISGNEKPATEAWMVFSRCESGATNVNDCTFTKGIDFPCTGGIYFRCKPLRLVNGTTPNSGVIEAGMFRQLQMFCAASDFTVEAANVTCNLLGYKSVGSVSAVKLAVANNGIVFSGSIQCNGTEQSLEMCDVVQEQLDCQDSSVVYIECLDGPIQMIPIENKTNEGVLTFNNYNTLWMVKGRSVSSTTAKTLCNLLGHGFEGKSQYLRQLPEHVRLPKYSILTEIECNGNETDVAQCLKTPYYHNPCWRCPIIRPSGFAVLHCAECSPDYFGTHCTECNCNNRSTGPCDTETGECTCKAGWSGTSCELDIDECLTPNVCPKNSDCKNVPGSYQCVCRPGYTLTDSICSVVSYEEETEPKSNLLVIILSSVIGGLVMISIIAIFCLCKYRMKGQKNTPDSVESSTTNRPSNEYTLSSTNKSEHYSTIDDRSLHTTRELTNTESVINPYNIIHDRPGLNQMNMNKKDAGQMADKKDYDYPYPSVLPTDEAGYLKLDKAGKILTDKRKNSPHINADTNNQPLKFRNRAGHDFHQIKH